MSAINEVRTLIFYVLSVYINCSIKFEMYYGGLPKTRQVVHF